MKHKNKQQGFTIIELVVVILLLGILTATALPRFMDVTVQAHGAVNDGVQSALAASTSMFRASHVAAGQPASGTVVTPYGIPTNSAGFPSATGADEDAYTAADCAAIYGALMQAGAPTVAASGTPTAVPTATEINAKAHDFKTYVLAHPNDTTCNYAYTGIAVTSGGLVNIITYNTTTGVVDRATATVP